MAKSQTELEKTINRFMELWGNYIEHVTWARKGTIKRWLNKIIKLAKKEGAKQ
jgi:hypothetical protein